MVITDEGGGELLMTVDGRLYMIPTMISSKKDFERISGGLDVISERIFKGLGLTLHSTCRLNGIRLSFLSGKIRLRIAWS